QVLRRRVVQRLIDGQVYGVITGIANFEHHTLADAALDIEVPADGVGVERVGIVERNALAEERRQSRGRARGLLDTGRERVVQCYGRPQVAGSGGAEHGTAGTEAGLVDSLGADGGDKHAHTGPDHRTL